MSNARKTALSALIKTEENNAYSNITIDKTLSDSELSNVDKSFVSALYYGVIERRITLDYAISKYLKQPLSKLKPYVRICLEMGFYQLVYMDKVPDSAAVNETVKLIKESKYIKISGFVNAVMRSFLRDNKEIVYPSEPLKRLEIMYSVPTWIVKLFTAQYGAYEAESILKGFLNEKGITIRVNTVKTTVDTLESELEKQCEVERSELCENALILRKTGSVRSLFGFDDGLFHIEDIASQLCVKALCAKSGERVLDVCAAPGGKSFTIAQDMSDKGEVYALDLYEQKIKLIKNGAKRLGLSCINSFKNDALKYNEKLCNFDKVLCDLPCSGLGILGKKPEIRYKNVAFIDNLPQLQYDLLQASKLYVKCGGLLVYSTCTLNDKENNEVAKRFLCDNADFELTPIFADLQKCKLDSENTITLFPHIHNTDGFFIAAFKRVR